MTRTSDKKRFSSRGATCHRAHGHPGLLRLLALIASLTAHASAFAGPSPTAAQPATAPLSNLNAKLEVAFFGQRDVSGNFFAGENVIIDGGKLSTLVTGWSWEVTGPATVHREAGQPLIVYRPLQPGAYTLTVSARAVHPNIPPPAPVERSFTVIAAPRAGLIPGSSDILQWDSAVSREGTLSVAAITKDCKILLITTNLAASWNAETLLDDSSQPICKWKLVKVISTDGAHAVVVAARATPARAIPAKANFSTSPDSGGIATVTTQYHLPITDVAFDFFAWSNLMKRWHHSADGNLFTMDTGNLDAGDVAVRRVDNGRVAVDLPIVEYDAAKDQLTVALTELAENVGDKARVYGSTTELTARACRTESGFAAGTAFGDSYPAFLDVASDDSNLYYNAAARGLPHLTTKTVVPNPMKPATASPPPTSTSAMSATAACSTASAAITADGLYTHPHGQKIPAATTGLGQVRGVMFRATPGGILAAYARCEGAGEHYLGGHEMRCAGDARIGVVNLTTGGSPALTDDFEEVSALFLTGQGALYSVDGGGQLAYRGHQNAPARPTVLEQLGQGSAARIADRPGDTAAVDGFVDLYAAYTTADGRIFADIFPARAQALLLGRRLATGGIETRAHVLEVLQKVADPLATAMSWDDVATAISYKAAIGVLTRNSPAVVELYLWPPVESTTSWLSSRTASPLLQAMPDLAQPSQLACALPGGKEPTGNEQDLLARTAYWVARIANCDDCKIIPDPISLFPTVIAPPSQAGAGRHLYWFRFNDLQSRVDRRFAANRPTALRDATGFTKLADAFSNAMVDSVAAKVTMRNDWLTATAFLAARAELECEDGQFPVACDDYAMRSAYTQISNATVNALSGKEPEGDRLMPECSFAQATFGSASAARKDAIELGRKLITAEVGKLISLVDDTIDAKAADAEYSLDQKIDDFEFDAVIARGSGDADFGSTTLWYQGSNATAALGFLVGPIDVWYKAKIDALLYTKTLADIQVALDQLSGTARFTMNNGNQPGGEDRVAFTDQGDAIGFSLAPGQLQLTGAIKGMKHKIDTAIGEFAFGLIGRVVGKITGFEPAAELGKIAGALVDELVLEPMISDSIEDATAKNLVFELPPAVDLTTIDYRAKPRFSGSIELAVHEGTTPAIGLRDVTYSCPETDCYLAKADFESTGLQAFQNWTLQELTAVLLYQSVTRDGGAVTIEDITFNIRTDLARNILYDIQGNNQCYDAVFCTGSSCPYKALLAVADDDVAAKIRDSYWRNPIKSKCQVPSARLRSGAVFDALSLNARMVMDKVAQSMIGNQQLEIMVKGPAAQLLAADRIVRLDRARELYEEREIEPVAEDILGPITSTLWASAGIGDIGLSGGDVRVTADLGIAWDGHRPNYGALAQDSVAVAPVSTAPEAFAGTSNLSVRASLGTVSISQQVVNNALLAMQEAGYLSHGSIAVDPDNENLWQLVGIDDLDTGNLVYAISAEAPPRALIGAPSTPCEVDRAPEELAIKVRFDVPGQDHSLCFDLNWLRLDVYQRVTGEQAEDLSPLLAERFAQAGIEGSVVKLASIGLAVRGRARLDLSTIVCSCASSNQPEGYGCSVPTQPRSRPRVDLTTDAADAVVSGYAIGAGDVAVRLPPDLNELARLMFNNLLPYLEDLLTQYVFSEVLLPVTAGSSFFPDKLACQDGDCSSFDFDSDFEIFGIAAGAFKRDNACKKGTGSFYGELCDIVTRGRLQFLTNGQIRTKGGWLQASIQLVDDVPDSWLDQHCTYETGSKEQEQEYDNPLGHPGMAGAAVVAACISRPEQCAALLAAVGVQNAADVVALMVEHPAAAVAIAAAICYTFEDQCFGRAGIVAMYQWLADPDTLSCAKSAADAAVRARRDGVIDFREQDRAGVQTLQQCAADRWQELVDELKKPVIVIEAPEKGDAPVKSPFGNLPTVVDPLEHLVQDVGELANQVSRIGVKVTPALRTQMAQAEKDLSAVIRAFDALPQAPELTAARGQLVAADAKLVTLSARVAKLAKIDVQTKAATVAIQQELRITLVALQALQ
ncbi:MAG: hypothetical protein HYV63_24955 [Candidatus Schekmanbacteria bacterium]|nr:hypothetical protein [Candidatus Schekmanbacteria bacterium]